MTDVHYLSGTRVSMITWKEVEKSSDLFASTWAILDMSYFLFKPNHTSPLRHSINLQRVKKPFNQSLFRCICSFEEKVERTKATKEKARLKNSESSFFLQLFLTLTSS